MTRFLFKTAAWSVILLSFIPLSLFIASQLGQYAFFCEIISNFQLYIFWGLLPFPFLLFALKRWRWATVVSAATLWSLALVAYSYLPTFQSPSGPTQVRLMSFNVLGSNSQHVDVIQQINEVEPDILVISEYTRYWHVVLDVIVEDYPYSVRVPRWHGFGIAIFSKFPIRDHQVVQLSRFRTDNPCVLANVEIDNQVVQLGCVHVVSPTQTKRLEIRNQQLREAGEAVSQVEVPTLLCGDFNCTTWSPFLQRLLKRTHLRHSRRGFGYQGSFKLEYPQGAPDWIAKNVPLYLPIDHVLVSKEIHIHHREIGENDGSDHYPVICDFSISESEVPNQQE